MEVTPHTDRAVGADTEHIECASIKPIEETEPWAPPHQDRGLTVLADGNSKENIEPCIDIIFIHGAVGDSRSTWGNCEVYWPRDLLPEEFPNARILTYGYALNTNKVSNHGTDLLGCIENERLDKINGRPIIFICHGLGGLVAKKAVIASDVVSDDRSFLTKCTRGMIFIGTPHRGIEQSNYDGMMKTIDVELLRSLNCGSETLRDQLDSFPHLIKKHNIAVECFYEAVDSGNPHAVAEFSAILGLGERTRSINTNHLNMGRLKDKNDSAFRSIIASISRLCKHAKVEDPVLAEIPKNTYYIVPRNTSAIFTGRHELLKQIGNCILSKKVSPKVHPRRSFVLYGMGGSGKTQVALKFAEDHRDYFWGIFWIDATNEESAEKSYQKIAQIVGVGESSDTVKQWLTTTHEEWLLIIDNADDPEQDIARLFPSGNRGNILLTSRNPESSIHGTESQEIKDMQYDEAVDLLLKAAKMDPSNQELRQQARPIIEKLSYLALAIDQAGAFIRAQSVTFVEYLGVYEKHRKTLHSRRSVQGSDSYKWSVYTAWEVSFNAVQSLDPVSAEILQIFGFLHHEDIPEEIFRLASISLQGEPIPKELPNEVLRILKDRSGTDWDNFRWREGIARLISFSLIIWDRGEMIYSVHPLVHSWIGDRMEEGEKTRFKNLSKYLVKISILGWYRNRANDQSLSFKLLPHLGQTLCVAPPEWTKEHPHVTQEYCNVGYGSKSRKPFIRLAGRISSKKMLGPGHIDILVSAANPNSAFMKLVQMGETTELLMAYIWIIELLNPGLLGSTAILFL